MLLGCGLRRSEVAGLGVEASNVARITGRLLIWWAEGPGADGSRTRLGQEDSRHLGRASIRSGTLFRSIRKNCAIWGDGITLERRLVRCQGLRRPGCKQDLSRAVNDRLPFASRP